MPPKPQFYDSTDTNLQSGTITPPNIDGGDAYGPTTFRFWNDKAGATASLLHGAYIEPRAWNGVTWVNSGYPILDEKWIKMAVTGYTANDPTMEPQTTGELPIGTNQPLILSDIPRNCARTITVKVAAPAGVEELSQEVKLFLVYDGQSLPLPFRVALLPGSGVISDVRFAQLRRLRRGRKITASGTANVVVTTGAFVYDGSPEAVLDTTVLLNQNAADGALAATQSYYAGLTQKSDRTVTTTKGNKAVAPVKPALPAAEIFLGFVRVYYQAGGTSIIVTADVDMTGVIRGEFLVEAGAGLTVTIGAGNGFSATDTEQFLGSSSSLGVSDNTTNYIWKRPDGTFFKTTTAIPPEIGSDLLATVVTVAGAITAINDKRVIIDRALFDHVIILRKDGAITVAATDFAWDEVPFDAIIDKVVLSIGKKGTSASGSFKADVTTRPEGTDLGTAGTTIYTNNGTNDQRPSVAYNAAVLRAEAINHEVIKVAKGTRLAGDIVAVPGTITVNPQDLRLAIFLRRQ